ncbi:hypothetical protein IEQ34_004908 [Dendrobium chrysotoxum]|uniref:Uncharacterized protein n=1 Tax=Dendrobium chrysotoxum TaxID=161865 RepID=A0AAV7GSF2_DENCH|nr:hypothetical protein IEQ34_004908 [Dendrobium chrysotoxum]
MTRRDDSEKKSIFNYSFRGLMATTISLLEFVDMVGENRTMNCSAVLPSTIVFPSLFGGFLNERHKSARVGRCGTSLLGLKCLGSAQ